LTVNMLTFFDNHLLLESLLVVRRKCDSYGRLCHVTTDWIGHLPCILAI